MTNKGKVKRTAQISPRASGFACGYAGRVARAPPGLRAMPDKSSILRHALRARPSSRRFPRCVGAETHGIVKPRKDKYEGASPAEVTSAKARRRHAGLCCHAEADDGLG